MRFWSKLLLLYCITCSSFAADKSITLSLDEAILLAVRQNPNVQSQRLSLVTSKFSLWVQEWEFLPHYSFTAEAEVARNAGPYQHWQSNNKYGVNPGVSLLTPLGTTITVTNTNTQTDHFNPALNLSVIQPLLRGFGPAIVETALHNAQDSLVIAKLNIENTLINTVSIVINSYLDVISAEKRVGIDEEALKRAQKSVKDTRLFIKAGRKAANDLVTVEANVASAQSTLENDKNALLKARYALLTAIGLEPTANLSIKKININGLMKRYHKPNLTLAKQTTLSHSVEYQTETILLHGEKCRALAVAEDNARWKLDAFANVTTGGNTGGGRLAGFNSLFNGSNLGQGVGLKLEIPIDNQNLKQAILQSKIALKQAVIALRTKRWTIETSAINGWNAVNSAERALHFSEDAERLQQKTYHLSYEKYLHGLIDSLELQSAQTNLILEQQNLLRARIDYLKALVDLDQTMGHTLKTWDIKVRV